MQIEIYYKHNYILLLHNKLPFSQEDIVFNGHVIEARINAENPEKKFQPTPGKVKRLHLPQGFNIRVDSLYMLVIKYLLTMIH